MDAHSAAAQKLEAYRQNGRINDLESAIKDLNQLLETATAAERFDLYKNLSLAYRYRFLTFCAPSDAAASAENAAQAVQCRQPAALETLHAYGWSLTELYESSGGTHHIEKAIEVYESILGQGEPHGLSIAEIGLAHNLLLRYQESGNPRDLEKAYGVTLPVRRTHTKPHRMALYVHASALHAGFRRTGSLTSLDDAIVGFGHLHEPGNPAVPIFAAAFAEALVDRYAIFPAQEDIELASQVIVEVAKQNPQGAGIAECRSALAYGHLQYMLKAPHVRETYEGAAIVIKIKGLDGRAEAAVNLLRRASNSLAPGAPRRPICLARLGDALVFRSRMTHSCKELEEAVEICREAARLIPPYSPDAARVRRSLASALWWRIRMASVPSDDLERQKLESVENFENAASVGVVSDVFEGLQAAVEWSSWAYEESCAMELADETFRKYQAGTVAPPPVTGTRWVEFLRASQYLEAARRTLNDQLLADGRLNLDVVEDSSMWLVGTGIIGGEKKVQRWHKPAWSKLTEGHGNRLAYAWARVGEYQEAILAFERQPMVILDHGSAGNGIGPRHTEILDASLGCPLVYLIAADSGGYGLILDADHNTSACGLWLPGFTFASVMAMLYGEGYKRDEEIEGFGSYASGYIPGPSPDARAGLIAAYSFWQLYRDDRDYNKLWTGTLERIGGWLGENVLVPLEQTSLTGREITLIPTGFVGLLPIQLASLPDETRPTGRRYLIDSFGVRYAPSARVLCRPAVVLQEHRFLGVEDPWPTNLPPIRFARAEIAIAASTFPAQDVLRGSQASAPAFMQMLPSATVVHLCCHASGHFENPLHGTLALAGQYLYLRDLVSLHLDSARLIVLSACETGKVSRATTDQLINFASGLLGAGARAVVTSAWDIDDPSTCLLMLRFYYLWRILGLAPCAALRQAQQWLRDTTNNDKVKFCRSVLPEFGSTQSVAAAVSELYRLLAVRLPEDRSFADPYYWAAFTYSGQ